MKNAKPFLATAAIMAAVGGVSFLGVNAVAAQDGQNNLVEQIASKFQLNEEEVQAVFDDNREEKIAERQAEMSEKLQAKVDDGTITEAQKTAIEEKIAEIHAEQESLRNSDASRDEIHAQMKESRDALKTWVEEQDIDLGDILGGREGRSGKHGGMHDQEEMDTEADAETAS